MRALLDVNVVIALLDGGHRQHRSHRQRCRHAHQPSQGCLKICPCRFWGDRDASQRQHPLDVVGQFSEALAN